MNLQSKIAVSLFICLLVIWMVYNFARRRLAAGQVLFWLILLGGGEILTLFPNLVHRLSVFWGNLFPVSWITFLGILSLIAYLLYQSIQINQLHSRIVELTRTIAFLEKDIRDKKESDRE